ncbi:unnamed protein product [Aphanomyces euteiches]|nr:hypothetical protein AeRB84_003864 [Aphanomyces euteiches]
MGEDENAVLISIVSAQVVDSRVTASKDGIPRMEFKLDIWTDRRGQLSVWHKAKTFLNLWTTLTIQQLHQGLSPFDYPRDDVPTIEQINHFLSQAMESSLEWGIRVDAETVVYKVNQAMDNHPRSSSSMVNRDSSVVSHDDQSTPAEMTLVSATVDDFRVQTTHSGTSDALEYIQYRVTIVTAAHGSLHVWRRYSTFQDLAESLAMRDELPPLDLQPSQLVGTMIYQRLDLLNQFLKKATTDPKLEWGIRIDNEGYVLKLASTPPNEFNEEPLQLLVKSQPESHQVSLISVAVKGYRVSRKNEQGAYSIKYNAQLECLSNIHGLVTYSIWRKYSTFQELENSLNLGGNSRLSDPAETIRHDKALIEKRIVKLNQFLEFISTTDELEWGIRVDEETTVYKRRVV